MPKDEVQIALVVAYDSQNPSQPPELMAYDDSTFPMIGKVISKWSLLEQELHLLIHALLKKRSHQIPGWHKRGFNQRWTVLEEEWRFFAGASDELMTEWAIIDRQMRKTKLVRDGIAHSRIRLGINNAGQWVRFQNENRNFPWSKRYYANDLAETARVISDTTGRLFRFTVPRHASHFSSQSRSLLQQLPDMDSLRFPSR